MSSLIHHSNYDLSSAMQSDLREIEKKAWLIEKMLLMPKYEAWIRREVAFDRASATTRIEGIGDGGETDPPDLKLVDQANENALRAYEFIDYLSDLKDQSLNELVVRQINRDFLHGAAAPLTPGVYRKGQNMVGPYTPPNQGDLPELMRNFVAWLQQGADHPILAAGLAHLRLVAIHPFWDGNGRTARGLEALILQRSEFHFKKLLSMEKRFLDVRAHYFAAIERTLGTKYGSYDATPWLDFYLKMLSAEADRLISQLTTWHQHVESLHREARQLGLLNRQADAIAFLLRTGRLTRADYVDITDVAPVTATRDLKDLIAKGLIIAEGATASRHYLPSALVEQAITRTTEDSTPAEQMKLFEETEQQKERK